MLISERTALCNLLFNRPDNDFMRFARQQFKANGFIKFPGFITEIGHDILRKEVADLESLAVRKDFIMPTSLTPRHIHVIGGSTIRKHGDIINRIYDSNIIGEFIESIVESPTWLIDHVEEFAVINILTGVGDTHGWHVDDPRYAFVLAIDTPKDGGYVELDGTYADNRSRANDGPISHDVQMGQTQNPHSVSRIQLDDRDAYLLDAGAILHRVTPLIDGRRAALNMAFHDEPTVTYGETANILYGQGSL